MTDFSLQVDQLSDKTICMGANNGGVEHYHVHNLFGSVLIGLFVMFGLLMFQVWFWQKNNKVRNSTKWIAMDTHGSDDRIQKTTTVRMYQIYRKQFCSQTICHDTGIHRFETTSKDIWKIDKLGLFFSQLCSFFPGWGERRATRSALEAATNRRGIVISRWRSVRQCQLSVSQSVCLFVCQSVS